MLKRFTDGRFSISVKNSFNKKLVESKIRLPLRPALIESTTTKFFTTSHFHLFLLDRYLCYHLIALGLRGEKQKIKFENFFKKNLVEIKSCLPLHSQRKRRETENKSSCNIILQMYASRALRSDLLHLRKVRNNRSSLKDWKQQHESN